MKKIIVIQSNTVFKTFKYFTKGQLDFLNTKGLEVHTICSPDSEAEDFFKNENAIYHSIKIERDISLVKDIVSVIKITSSIKKITPHIVQGSTPKAAFLTLLGAWINRVPVRIFFMRGVRSSVLSGIKQQVVGLMEKITCRLAHQVLCTSNSVREEIINKGICPPEKAKVLHHGTGNGINTLRFNKDNFTLVEKNALYLKYNIDKNARILLFVGRLVKDKGIIELCHAWQILKKKFPDVILILAGNEENINPIPPDIINGLKNDKRVRMLGFINDCAPLYSIATIVILPSYGEGIPISILEASAMELPVVVSKVTGCIDAVIDNQTGKLANPRDAKDLEKKITLYLLNPELCKKHGIAGRKMVQERFQSEVIWEALYEQYIRLYKEL